MAETFTAKPEINNGELTDSEITLGTIEPQISKSNVINEIKEKFDKLEKETITELNKCVNDLLAEVNKRGDVISNLRTNMSTLSNNFYDAERKIEDQEERIDELLDDNEDLEAERNKKEEEIKDLKYDLETLDENYHELLCKKATVDERLSWYQFISGVEFFLLFVAILAIVLMVN